MKQSQGRGRSGGWGSRETTLPWSLREERPGDDAGRGPPDRERMRTWPPGAAAARTHAARWPSLSCLPPGSRLLAPQGLTRQQQLLVHHQPFVPVSAPKRGLEKLAKTQVSCITPRTSSAPDLSRPYGKTQCGHGKAASPHVPGRQPRAGAGPTPRGQSVSSTWRDQVRALPLGAGLRCGGERAHGSNSAPRQRGKIRMGKRREGKGCSKRYMSLPFGG